MTTVAATTRPPIDVMNKIVTTRTNRRFEVPELIRIETVKVFVDKDDVVNMEGVEWLHNCGKPYDIVVVRGCRDISRFYDCKGLEIV